MFQVGDIVKGVRGSIYVWTNELSTCEVVSVSEFDETSIEVLILTHESSPSQIGRVWPVNSEYFELLSNNVDVKPLSETDFLDLFLQLKSEVYQQKS